MAVSLLLGFALILAAVAGAIAMVGGNLVFVLDAGFFVFVALAPIGAAIAGPGLGALAAAFRSAAAPTGAASVGELGAGKATIRLLLATTLASGLLGFIINFTWILKALEDRNALAMNIGMGFIPMIYALTIAAALYLPLLHRLESAEAGCADEGMAAGAGSPGPRRILGWALGFLICTLSAMAAYRFYLVYSFSLFFDAASFCLVLLVPLAMAIAGPGLSGLGRAIAVARGAEATIAECRKAKAVFRSMTWAMLVAIGLGLLLGYAYMLAEYGNRQRVGPCAALMLITLFWGLIVLVGFSLPLEAAARRRLAAGQ